MYVGKQDDGDLKISVKLKMTLCIESNACSSDAGCHDRRGGSRGSPSSEHTASRSRESFLAELLNHTQASARPRALARGLSQENNYDEFIFFFNQKVKFGYINTFGCSY